ncbi:NAD(P)-dependent oxidoreductase [Sphingopyxis sp. GW247-27LB]|uniref:NAD(P)-dependent oxidoreductase n=1 Tax=Sphingopyxis sp. GW247-27LB TaxID=2012632 RepID=UPI000BA6D758|nr:NAD(P)-dependent oxidoreductase [Sphingopyxis sp. GW247-27LB]PAL24601.1 dehydrogenase [Sphingopyxis sp. GW247-27LB]
MNIHKIVIAGPPGAQTFLERLASAVASDKVRIDLQFGLSTPTDAPGWSETQILVSFGVPCTGADMDAAPRLKAIITPSLGYEGIDVEAAHSRGIAFANGRVAENFESVAEAAVLFMLTSLYRLREAEERLRRDEVRTGPPRARMLKGKTVGIIGHGNIAKALIERLQGWETRILLCNRSRVPPSPAFEQCDLDTLVAQSDLVLPLLPLTPGTDKLLSRARLLAMKPGAILINLSRGAIVDENALADPEVTAHLGTIALDVFVTEPLPADSPLRDLPDQLLTNHEISHTQENLGALFAMAVANVEAAIAGAPMPTTFKAGS